MSRHAQNQLSPLNPDTLNILNRPDLRPLLGSYWKPESDPNRFSKPTCVLQPDFAWTNTGSMCVGRRDLEDLRRIWLKDHYGYTQKPSLLHGYWRVDNWGQTGDSLISILQYKTLRICLRGGVGYVGIGTADVNNIISLCLERIQSKNIPRCIGCLMYEGKHLEWLLLPVEGTSSNGLMAYIRNFKEIEARTWEQGREAGPAKILAEFKRRQDLGISHMFNKLLHHENKWSQIWIAADRNIQPPEGYEALLDVELETLLNLTEEESVHPCPLPLIADDRA